MRDMIQGGSVGTMAEFPYFDIAETGAVLELLYLDGTQMPSPDLTIA
jgi:hypothetical protein